jgi:uncharacterized damage-inducible protein DinB
MKTTAKENLKQLEDLISTIGTGNYNKESSVLSGATIGQHIRHILEFYLLLVSGSFTGTISYDKRERDLRIETDPAFAANTIRRLLTGIDMLEETQSVRFDADYSFRGTSQNTISSSVGRELAYCIEHSIHHQAIIKAGLIELGLGSIVNENFGVAYSTIRYRNDSCAQ